MANLNAPLGLAPIRGASGKNSPRIERFTVAASVEIFRNQLVGLNASGLVTDYTDALAVAGDLIGVAGAYVSASQTDREIPVYCDPDQEYEIQADDGGTAIADDDLVRLNVTDVVNPTSGTTTTGFSSCEMDADAVTSVVGTNTTTIRPLQILRVPKQVGEEREVDYAKYVVRISPPCHAYGRSGLTTFSGV